MSEIISSHLLTAGGATSLGIGLVILTLFLSGKLPTPAERKQQDETIKAEREMHEHELAEVRSNLRRDLDEVQAIVAQKDQYIRDLVQGIMGQQDSIQSTNQTLSELTRQLPVLIYAVQQLIQDKKST